MTDANDVAANPPTICEIRQPGVSDVGQQPRNYTTTVTAGL